jgi:hypothetical protein
VLWWTRWKSLTLPTYTCCASWGQEGELKLKGREGGNEEEGDSWMAPGRLNTATLAGCSCWCPLWCMPCLLHSECWTWHLLITSALC